MTDTCVSLSVSLQTDGLIFPGRCDIFYRAHSKTISQEVITLPETITLALEFPRSFVTEQWPDKDAAILAIKQSAVMDLYRQRKISLRKAAELLGLAYRDFLLLAAQHKITPFEYETGWAERELADLAIA